ncbi:L,D-transpeptidase Cds6 family protein [Sulfurirhabdus autotrophica]|uniref:Murein L,D-transpeptidase YafK n=1 Tax=Sulfurirhabdus autotrophica TaxID=1706046 RepID=A0A4R3YFU2_9PROT|nr:L,D-transpeptidase family protein [Sulfurirhabdus autotrophica]TCV90861.1 murein L,D-transpeptidase YafK [Sulfurirhabdus autotrophica]
MIKRFKKTIQYGVLAALTFATPSAIPMGGPVPRHFQPINNVPQAPLSLESMLVQSLLDIQRNQLGAALSNIEALLKINPNFRLAQLIKGDLLMARAQPISNIGSATDAPQQSITDFRDEARARLQRYVQQPPTHLVPSNLLQLQTKQKYAIVVDISKSRLYLFGNTDGKLQYDSDYYITVGKNGGDKTKEGDLRTPTGVYFVTANLPKGKLTDFYGTGAFPISYPNEWDKKMGRNGHGIWLHGTPGDTYSRPPRASSGCVVLTNQDLDSLAKKIQVGLTPVVITEKIEWVDQNRSNAQRIALNQQIDNWRHDWESRDTNRYIQNYSKNFHADGQKLPEWEDQKRQVNASKSWIKVNLSNVSIFRYPEIDNMAVVTFDQDYQSNNLSNQMRKRQYWKLENNQWKIVYEGAVS